MAERAWDFLVSPRVGLITDLSPQYRGPEEPVPPYLYTSTLAHFDFRPAPRQERLNAGKGRTEEEAKLSALGEAVERYSAYHWDFKRTWIGLPEGGAITPADCVLFSEEQYRLEHWRYRRWAPNIETTWIRGVELPSGDSVALPAALVYLVQPTPRIEDQYTAVTSNGLAAGSTLTHAILGGLYEVIERDALMITWLNRLPATEIETPEFGCQSASIIRHYRRFGVTVRLLKLATDQLPVVVMAVADDRDEGRPARVIGMGCDIDPFVACDKAMFELCQARPSQSSHFREKPPAGRIQTYQDVVDLDDHPAFHSLRENLHEFDFLCEGNHRTSLAEMDRPEFGDTEVTLAQVVGRLRDSGARVAYAEITTEDVASAGFHVVRAIATGFQPIHFGWGEARLGGRRLFNAPMAWGMANQPSVQDALNNCPHPLA
jgi:ribosomal protein S12 methylthiotransferase accessory factor